MWQREPGCPTSGPMSHVLFSSLLKHPNLRSAEDVDALLLGMASQIAEREDHVVVEDVQGEPEAVPAGCESLTPGRRSSWTCRGRQRGRAEGCMSPLAERISDPLTMIPFLPHGSNVPGIGWSGLGWRLPWWPSTFSTSSVFLFQISGLVH